MSKDRTSGTRLALFVSCLFVLVVVSTLRWRAQAPALTPQRPTTASVIGLLPQRVGAEIRAADVLGNQDVALAGAQFDTNLGDVFAGVKSEGQLATPETAILSHAKNTEQPQIERTEFPAFDLLKDEAYQRSRAQALAERTSSNHDLPAMRSPALSKIFRELHMREIQKTRQADVPAQASAAVRSNKPAKPPGIDLTAQGALGPTPGALSWPEATRLFEELKDLNDPFCQLWARKVQSGVDALRSAQSIFDPTTKQALAELVELRQEANHLLDRIQDEEDKSRMLIAAYGLRRRTDVWSAVAKAANPAVERRATEIASSIDRRQMLVRIADLERMLKGTPHESAWADYLKLDEIETLAVSPAVFDVTKRTPIARLVLGRCNTDSASEKQRKFLSSPAVVNLDRELRQWVTQPIDLQQLVYAIEEFELHPYQRHVAAITESWNRLRWSLLREYADVAEVIDLHYRNANMRISVTEDFMNRLIPAMQNVKSKIREQILGAEVRGLSTSNMKLYVDLIEDQDSIRMRLQADGRMAANTQSTKGPVTVLNFNRSNFVLEKPFVLNRGGLQTGPARAAASGDSNIVGMQTRYDTLPLLGAMVRRIAQQRAFETRPLQLRIFDKLVSTNAREQIDSQVSRQINVTQQHIERQFIDQLQKMELEPKTIALSSSDVRALYRGRLAGDHQLAAFTARPKAVEGSYLSMQVHMSAVNNFLRQMDLDGQRGSIREVMETVIAQLGLTQVKVPDDLPDDVRIALAKQDSVRIDCDEDRVCFTLRIAELRTENRTWRKFAVRAFYAPKIDGFRCELHRDGTLELQGRRASNDLALRAIFVKVFSKNRPIPMIHPEVVKDRRMQDLQVDQFVARDGWIGVSIGERPKAQTAERHQQHNRHIRR